MSTHRDFRKQITDLFSLEEIKILCFDLSIPFDDILGEHLSSKVNALLVALFKLEKLDEFHKMIAEERPKASWPSIDELQNFQWVSLEKTVNLPQSIIQQISDFSSTNSRNINVGIRGVNIKGDVKDGVIITGDNNQISS